MGVWLVGATLLPVGAWAKDTAETRELRARIEAVEASLRKKGKQDEGGDLAVIATLSLRLNRIEEELRRMNGDVQEGQYRIRQMQQKLENLTGDLDLRLRDAEKRIGAVEGGGKLSSRTPTRKKTPAAESASLLPEDPEALYQFALDKLLSKKDHKASRAAIDAFITRYPDHPKAGLALYWLGESHYIQGEFKSAAEAYLESYASYGGSEKAVDSLLKLGMSLSALGRAVQACSTYDELATRFPDAPQRIKNRLELERTRAVCSKTPATPQADTSLNYAHVATRMLTDAAFDAAMMGVLPHLPDTSAPARRFAVGVSGGADSLALLVCLAAWRKKTGAHIFALSVDHGLRAEASEEIAHAARVARRLSIPHIVLRGRMVRGASKVQARARETRYRLMHDWCRRTGCTALLVAHHVEDQAETFLFRLARGSGPDGLAAMLPARDMGAGVFLLRPLLATPRASLRARLRAEGVSWREDPSNTAPQFARTHLGAALEILRARGVSPSRFAQMAGRFAEIRCLRAEATQAWLKTAARADAGGFTIDRARLRRTTRAEARHALSFVLARVSGRSFPPPPSGALNRLIDALCAETPTPPPARTLAGCRIRATQDAVFIAATSSPSSRCL